MKISKRIIAVTGAIMILFSVICLPAFALEDSDPINDKTFNDQPIPVITSPSSTAQDNISVSFYAGFFYYYPDSKLREIYAFSTGNPNVYVGAYKDGNNIYIAMVSNEYFEGYSVTKSWTDGTETYKYGQTARTGVLNNGDTIMYTVNIANYNTTNERELEVPIYNSLEYLKAAVLDVIENPPVAETAHQINYSIPAGYVAFFDIHGLTNIRGSVKAFSAVALTPQQWASTNVLYGYTSSIPSSFNLPLTGSTSYSWNAGKTNIFGKSQNWSWLGIYSGNSNYLFISNPTYSNVTGVLDNGQSMIVDNPSATNSYVNVFLDQAYSVKLVSLNAVITYDPQNGNYGGIDDGNGDTTYDVEYNDESQQWVTKDQNGTPVGPEGIPIGGDNSIDTPSEFGNIAAWLENIAHQISAFFTGAIGAVTTLVNAGSAFIHQLISLYSWLPAPVYAVLSSALILVITIGVIKVFI